MILKPSPRHQVISLDIAVKTAVRSSSVAKTNDGSYMTAYRLRPRWSACLVAMISTPFMLLYAGRVLFNLFSPIELFATSTWNLFGIIVATIWVEIELNLLAELLAWAVGKLCGRFVRNEDLWLSWFFIIDYRKTEMMTEIKNLALMANS